MFAGLRRAATAKKQGETVRLKSALKSENKSYNHFTPIEGQESARFSKSSDFLVEKFSSNMVLTAIELRISPLNFRLRQKVK
jgi:hypothetical protein